MTKMILFFSALVLIYFLFFKGAEARNLLGLEVRKWAFEGNIARNTYGREHPHLTPSSPPRSNKGVREIKMDIIEDIIIRRLKLVTTSINTSLSEKLGRRNHPPPAPKPADENPPISSSSTTHRSTGVQPHKPLQASY